MRFLTATCFVLMAASCGAAAPTDQQKTVTLPAAPVVTDVWAPPSPTGVVVGAGYLTIRNGGREDALVGASTARAGRVEIHEMAMDGDVMRMRAADKIDLPAGGEITLAPGGQHLMFYELTSPFTAGETIEITLRFEHAPEIVVPMQVRAREGAHSGGH